MREILSEENIHPQIQHKMGAHQSVVDGVIKAIKEHKVVVVGMRQNPVCKAVKKNLNAADVSFKYLEFGSYFSEWKPCRD